MDGTLSRSEVYLDRLELENFKSYKGQQVVGPFSKFSCIVGPNGAGEGDHSTERKPYALIDVFPQANPI